MKQHFITINAYQTKNKAHAELHEFISQYDNCLIDDQKLAELRDKIEEKIFTVNEKYPRCQFIESKKWCYVDGHAAIAVEGNFQMNITEVKRFEVSYLESLKLKL